MPSSWLYLFLFSSMCINSIYSSSSSSALSYTKHCSSIVPESSTTARSGKISIPPLSTTYFSGGHRLLSRTQENQTHAYNRRYFKLRILQYNYQETIAPGTYKVEGVVIIRLPYRYDDQDHALRNYSSGGRRSRARGTIKFSMSGFWSETSRKLCMVGSATSDVSGFRTVDLDAVLKLSYGNEDNPTIYTGVISGSLESTASTNDGAYFDPISIFSFPDLRKYNYSYVSGRVSELHPSVRRNHSLSIEPGTFCQFIAWRQIFLEMEYETECREETQRCSSLTNGGSSPRILSVIPIQCSEHDMKFRYMAILQNFVYYDGSFNINSTLIGEALWDDDKNMIFGIACRLVDPMSQFGSAVGDCTMRLSLWYPSIWTIRNDVRILGEIWSSKPVSESGYFRKINLSSSDENGPIPSPGPRYEYTEMDKVRKSCERKLVKKKGDTYPDGHSYNMRFDMSLKNKKGEHVGWGYATPLSVGGDLYQGNNILSLADLAPQSSVVIEAKEFSYKIGDVSPADISYKITTNSDYPSSNNSSTIVITAEGAYDAETGYLCMVGCRKMARNLTSFRDCDILVKFEFPPLNARRGRLIKGTIESTRAKTDPLHFDVLTAQSAAYYVGEAEQSIWRMDLEIVLVLISNALACIFIALQIFHVKRNPEVSSFVSIVMLVVLSVGHMIPLVLNFEAVFFGPHDKQTLLLSNGGRLEANEVTVRVISLVAFLLQLRLLQLVWAAKESGGDGKSPWAGEILAGLVSLVLYCLGGLLSFILFNWTRSRSYGYRRYTLWGYAGLILDGFLLPQILLNIFIGSAEKALSRWFYMGTSAVRLVPHAYNQYRAHNYPQFDLNTTYYYANPAADFYSTAWDILIPCGVVALAVVVFLQQWRGGRCILPKRLGGLEKYEKVPAVENE